MMCPICKSNIVVEVKIPTFGVKGNSHIDHYECSGCFIMFADIESRYEFCGETNRKDTEIA